MNAPSRQLRSVQIACILLLLACIGLSRFQGHRTADGLTTRDWLVIGAAIWSAVSGFGIQHRIVNTRPRSPKLSGTSTPFSRWRVGNLVRLACATAVGGWSLYLSEIGGPIWIVDAFFVVGLLLLLAWTPGTSPDQTPS